MLILTTQVFDNFCAAFATNNYDTYVFEGSSRSSKTRSVIQFIIRWCFETRSKPTRGLITRSIGTWLKATAVYDFIKVLKETGLYNPKMHNKSEGAGIYKLYNCSIYFSGLDDPQRVHGMETDWFWINEAIESTFDDYAQLKQRCTGFAILDYNPSEEEHWIYDKVNTREKTFYNHSTFKDNPFIPVNAKNQILSYEPTEENYKNGTVDKRKWEIYGLGKRAKIEGLVFTNFTIIDGIPLYVKQRFTGIDFGYTNDVTAMSENGILNNELYIDEFCYKTYMNAADIILQLKQANKGRKIWSESADPRLIDEIYNAGFNIHAVSKYKGSIESGLDKMKSMKIFITSNSMNAIREFKNYTYKQDKNGKWLNEPIDSFNHIIDEVRYTVLMELLGKKRNNALSKFANNFR